MIFTNYIQTPVPVCKVKSACTGIKPVKTIDGKLYLFT
jgi:hypothetical protein